MKTLLMLLCTLGLAVVYCDISEIVFEGNCIGIKHSIPDKPSSTGYLISGSWVKYEICCDQEFDRNTNMTGFSSHMARSDISGVITSNYDLLTREKTNCKKQASGVAK